MPISPTTALKLLPWGLVLVLSASSYLLFKRNEALVAKGARCEAELLRLTEDAQALRDRAVLFAQQQAALNKDLHVARSRLRQAQVPTDCEGAMRWLANEVSR